MIDYISIYKLLVAKNKPMPNILDNACSCLWVKDLPMMFKWFEKCVEICEDKFGKQAVDLIVSADLYFNPANTPHGFMGKIKYSDKISHTMFFTNQIGKPQIQEVYNLFDFGENSALLSHYTLTDPIKIAKLPILNFGFNPGRIVTVREGA